MSLEEYHKAYKNNDMMRVIGNNIISMNVTPVIEATSILFIICTANGCELKTIEFESKSLTDEVIQHITHIFNTRRKILLETSIVDGKLQFTDRDDCKYYFRSMYRVEGTLSFLEEISRTVNRDEAMIDMEAKNSDMSTKLIEKLKKSEVVSSIVDDICFANTIHIVKVLREI